MRRFRGGLVFKLHRLLYLSTLGSRVIKKKKKELGVLDLASGGVFEGLERRGDEEGVEGVVPLKPLRRCFHIQVHLPGDSMLKLIKVKSMKLLQRFFNITSNMHDV